MSQEYQTPDRLDNLADNLRIYCGRTYGTFHDLAAMPDTEPPLIPYNLPKHAGPAGCCVSSNVSRLRGWQAGRRGTTWTMYEALTWAAMGRYRCTGRKENDGKTRLPEVW